MTTAPAEEWARVTELFSATFEAAPAERQRLLDAAGVDPALRERVERLLCAHDADGGALDQPALTSLDGLDPSALQPAPSLVGRTLGPWKVLRQVARGGMGAVYEAARQDDQFAQRVAVKTLRVGLDSAVLLARFRQERRILAALQHPNIAALYDGGVTDDGLPYFVLEYVDGRPIDRYCDELALPLPARLDLFRQVAGAVQYAHRQLVIHRDLKPGNILVTADGVVKLVDFGIAKLLEEDAPGVSAEARAPLTLDYASPEQVRGEAISTASDVYSLGAVLYRLLTGRTPIELSAVSLGRAVTMVAEAVPELPSVARRDPRGRAAVAGDLDAVVMMALRKEADRRYPTVQAFADDVQRYLKGLPVAAAPESFGYRLRSFARRRRTLAVGLAVAATAILGGSMLALWQARAAREEARRATVVAEFLKRIIGAADVTAASGGARIGARATVAELLDSAARRVPLELADEPDIRGGVHLSLGRSYTVQGRWPEAQAQFDSAIRVLDRAGADRSLDRARALTGMAEVEMLRGGSRGDSLSRLAQDGLRHSDHLRSVEHARVLRLLGMSRALAGDWVRADSFLTASVQLYQELDRRPSGELALALADRAGAREASGAAAAVTEPEFRRAMAIFDSLPDSDVVEKGSVLWYASRLELARGHLDRADSLSRQGLRVFELATGPQSQFVAQQLVQLAELARYRGDTATARLRAEQAIAIVRARPEMHPVIRDRVLMERARSLWIAGRLAGADSSARAAWESRRAAGNETYTVEAGQLLGAILRDEHRLPESEQVLLDGWRRLSPALAGMRPLYVGSLTRLYYAWGRPGAAAPYLEALPDSLRQALLRSIRKH